ncbi:MAG: GNAT family N-acetyltransferase [Actinobacteria bacterium]|nr:GNAT family N-acetyltransferase [Actinomycetota bacterium]
MDLTIRPVAAEEVAEFVRSQELTFGYHLHPEDVKGEALIFEPDRTLGVFDGDRQVGGALACTFEMTVPHGRFVPTAGITSVGVHPTHRRRGLLTNLMRLQLDDVHERGEPLAALWASEGPIYGRFGYGMSSPAASFSVRTGYSAYFYALHQTDGVDDAYAAYRMKGDWQDHTPNGEARIDELIGTTPQAYAEMWRYVLDLDLTAKVVAWPRPVDDALLLTFADPRRLRMRLTDGLWIRVVEVSPALAARRYQGEGAVTFDVADPFCDWNQGTWTLEVGPDGATCTRSSAEPDISLDATALGAAYLGATSFSRLAWARRAQERTTGALQRADALFASPLAPYCPFVF